MHIAALPKGTEWVLPPIGSKKLQPCYDSERRIAGVVKAAGLDPDVVVRHTAVTHPVEAGVDVPTV